MDGTWWDRLRRVDHRLWDGLLALVLLVVGVLVFATRARRPDEPPEELGFALVVVAAVALAWRRRAPLVVALVVMAATSVASLFGYWPEFVVFAIVSVYTAAANVERRRLLTVLLPATVAAGVAIGVGESAARGLNAVEIAFALVTGVAVPILFGRMTYNRRRRIARERDLATREAVAVERATIARELHDVVAHHMSVMVVHAGAARSVVGTDAAAAADALRQIEASGRTGLAEMRRLLDILKTGAVGDDRAPQPGLDELDGLLEGMRATGLPVEAVIQGEPRPLPPGVDLSAYRIVQEALTNTLRHAGPASARVLVRYELDAVELEVSDDGQGPAATGATGATGGQGLIGMRERARLFGGDLDAGPRPGGGYVVSARLPTGGPT